MRWLHAGCLVPLHAATFAHGHLSMHTVARLWDGSWRVIDLYRARPQGQPLDEDTVGVVTASTEAYAVHAAEVAARGGGRQQRRGGGGAGSLGALLKSTVLGQSKELQPLKLPSVAPEAPRRATEAADLWAAGVLAAGILGRSSCKRLPCAARLPLPLASSVSGLSE